MKIEFVEYTGKYPCLCSGILVLNIDGKEYVFGGKRKNGKLVSFNFGYRNEPSDYENGWLKPGLYRSFWSSGGGVWFENGWDEHVESGDWVINVEDLPEELKPCAEEIGRVFNENVPQGCCGGCI